MASHWAYVQMTLLTLAMRIGPLDEDGLDLVYANGRHHAYENMRGFKILPKFRKSMLSAYNDIINMEEPIHTDMSTTLSQIFDAYTNLNRKQTLIILNDGLSEGSKRTADVEQTICSFVANLKKRLGKQEPRWFSIHFITIRNNTRALDRPQALDDDLETR